MLHRRIKQAGRKGVWLKGCMAPTHTHEPRGEATGNPHIHTGAAFLESLHIPPGAENHQRDLRTHLLNPRHGVEAGERGTLPNPGKPRPCWLCLLHLIRSSDLSVVSSCRVELASPCLVDCWSRVTQDVGADMAGLSHRDPARFRDIGHRAETSLMPQPTELSRWHPPRSVNRRQIQDGGWHQWKMAGSGQRDAELRRETT